MHVEVITSQKQLAAVRDQWEAVYTADPQAQLFLSWSWLARWLASPSVKWFVLAAKRSAADERYVGFFPLRTRTRMNQNGTVSREIAMAGNRLADYTGFICHPDVEQEVTLAFARRLKAMSWATLCLDCFAMSEARTSLFLACFPRKDFTIGEREMVNRKDGINNGICPYLALPDSFERYLDESMGANSRQKARRFLRKLEEPGGSVRITHATAQTLERDLAILARLWKDKWAARKGDRTEPILRCLTTMLRYCHEQGLLFMPVLWDGDTPLGVLGILIDAARRSLLFQVSGLDTSRNNPAPGLLLHAYSIRYAIENGFTRYDFLRGNEPYKYMFGATDRRIRYIEVRCRTAKAVRPVMRERATDVPPWDSIRPPFRDQPRPMSLSGLALTPPDSSPAAIALGLDRPRSS